jgi:hypothetical protein
MDNDGRLSGVTPIGAVEEGAAAIFSVAISEKLAGCSGKFYSGCARQKRMLRPMMTGCASS